MGQSASGGKGAIVKSPNAIATVLVVYNFDIDSSDLKAEHKQWLDKEVIPLLKANPKTTVSLRGTASKSGDAAYNREPLSKARAEAVKKHLLDPKNGVNPKQITADWVGADYAKLKEYEGDRAVIVFVTTPLTIDEVTFWNDNWTKKLAWDDIIGLDESNTSPKSTQTGIRINNVNVQVTASGAPRSSMPDYVSIQLRSSVPNMDNWGQRTLTVPVDWLVPRATKEQAKDLAQTWYRHSVPIANVGPFLATDRGKALEIALIVRGGGTADKKFRGALGSVAFRGRGEQANAASTGSERNKVPDAKRLLLAGGVEVLEAEVVARDGWSMKGASAARLIRSPADILFYSGHGLHKEGCLALEGDFHNYSVDGYRCWTYPWEIEAYWKAPLDLSALIISGCSVLDLDSHGKDWAQLLKAYGGPLDVILGYETGTLTDEHGANDIVAKMGRWISSNQNATPEAWVRQWLEINGDFVPQQSGAVGMESKNYWYISLGTTGGMRRRIKSRLGGDYSVGYDIKNKSID
jgi:hypothetical protein